MIGRTQAIARARRARSVSGGKAQYHELESGFLKKLISLMIAVSLATSMIPAAALANDVDAAETAGAADVVQTTDVVDADSNTGTNQTGMTSRTTPRKRLAIPPWTLQTATRTRLTMQTKNLL